MGRRFFYGVDMQTLTQSAAFSRIRALGLIVKKTDFGDYRVADPALPYQDGTRESAAAYCSDLQEAVDTAEAWASNKADAARVAAEAEGKAEALKTRRVATINATPTWAAVLPLLFAALENGTAEGKRIARAELERMAIAADSFNAAVAAKGRA